MAALIPVKYLSETFSFKTNCLTGCLLPFACDKSMFRLAWVYRNIKSECGGVINVTAVKNDRGVEEAVVGEAVGSVLC